MRAVVIREPGGLDVLDVVERPVPEVGPGEVRISVKAAAVNPTDIGLRERGTDGLAPPWIPGMDAAGIVDSVGPGVARVRAGQEVMAALTPRRPEGGAQAEMVVVPEASVVPVPAGATLPQAATLPMNGLTARLGLEMLGLEARSSLAVSGGAGLLASYVIALATIAESVGIADARGGDAELVRSFGADVIVPRDDGFPTPFARLPRAVSMPSSTRRSSIATRSRRFATAERSLSCANWDHGETERNIEIQAVMVGTALDRTDWRGSGSLRRRRAHRAARRGEYPPEEVAAAHRAMEAGGLRGHAVIVFSADHSPDPAGPRAQAHVPAR